MQKYLFLVLFFLVSVSSIVSQNSTEELIQELENKSDKREKLALLNTITKALVNSNSKKQLRYLNDYVALAKELKEYDLAAKKSRFIIQYYTNNAKLDSAKYVAENMLALKDKFKDKKSEAHLLLKRASYFFNTNKFKRSIKDYDAAAAIFLKEKDTIYAADATYFAGQAYNDLKDFVNTVTYYENAYQLYDIAKDHNYKSIVISELSGLYAKNGFYDKALLERKRNLKLVKKGKNYKFIGFAYGDLAKAHFQKKNYTLMHAYIDSLTFCIDSMKYKSVKSLSSLFVNNLKLDFHLEKNNTEIAEELLIKGKQLAKQTSSPAYFSSLMLPYEARVYMQQKNYAKAKKVLQKILEQKGQEGKDKDIKLAERNIAKVFAAKHNYSNAYKHLNNYVILEEDEHKIIKNNTFLYYQSQFETERKDAEILKKETEIKLLEKDRIIAKNRRNLLLAIFISIISAIITISYFITLQSKRKRKALANKLEKNKEALAEFTKQLLEKRRVQESLTQEIERLNDELGAFDTTENIQDLTSVKILTNDDWYLFKEKFTRVYPSFFKSIKEKGYNLTKAEERLLALEKLYLDTNEIASMLAISKDSVTKSRSRLRKKIEAPKEISILNYLEAS